MKKKYFEITVLQAMRGRLSKALLEMPEVEIIDGELNATEYTAYISAQFKDDNALDTVLRSKLNFEGWLRIIQHAEIDHNCNDYAVPYRSKGPLGHGWKCDMCGKLIQAG